ncbi:hypothetical protein OV079_50490 [Nannocystis pusilla]|uniref:Uncharacterized protein n=1 Tax=Nannocystis pusilla TaxID=889268 RepID=A0A9X3F099_9BACT|nr:hypothetical protein [Nannocystis pusilla]MCY1013627.1 hypothetical protein [Nannocystis pusilla]
MRERVLDQRRALLRQVDAEQREVVAVQRRLGGAEQLLHEGVGRRGRGLAGRLALRAEGDEADRAGVERDRGEAHLAVRVRSQLVAGVLQDLVVDADVDSHGQEPAAELLLRVGRHVRVVRHVARILEELKGGSPGGAVAVDPRRRREVVELVRVLEIAVDLKRVQEEDRTIEIEHGFISS